MAKFLTPFSICPLIDQQCFIDIRQDGEPNCIIVTMGKSIIMRFRLVDQKQLNSWTCQDKLSAAVVYDYKRACYVGIFNDEYIGSWANSQELKKLRKTKLPGPVRDLITYPGSRPLLVFRDGEVASLDESGDTLSTISKGFLSPTETLSRTDVVCLTGMWHFVAIVESSGGDKLYCKPLSGTGGFSLNLKHRYEKLSSFSIADDAIVTVWSDGIWVHSTVDHDGFPGKRIGLLQGLDCSRVGVAASAGDGLVALAGPASSGEGACICLLDAARGLIVTSAGLKFLPARPRLWVIGDWLVLPSGLTLTVVPFKRRVVLLNTLIGASASEVTPPVLLSWEHNGKKSQVTVEHSLPESRIVSQNVTALLEQGDVLEAVNTLLSLNDAPDSCIVDTIAALLKNQEDQSEVILNLLEIPLVGDVDTQKLIRNRIGEEAALKLLNILAEADLNYGGVSWAALLLDSFYQQLMLGGRPEVHKSLKNLQEHVANAREDAKAARELFCALSFLSHKPSATVPSSVQYAVEKLTLY